MVVLRKRGADCQFVSVLEPWKNEQSESEVSMDNSGGNGLRVVLRKMGGTDVITFRPTDIQIDSNAGGTGEKKTDVTL
jgi:hypothetical protein